MVSRSYNERRNLAHKNWRETGGVIPFTPTNFKTEISSGGTLTIDRKPVIKKQIPPALIRKLRRAGRLFVVHTTLVALVAGATIGTHKLINIATNLPKKQIIQLQELNIPRFENTNQFFKSADKLLNLNVFLQPGKIKIEREFTDLPVANCIITSKEWSEFQQYLAQNPNSFVLKLLNNIDKTKADYRTGKIFYRPTVERAETIEIVLPALYSIYKQSPFYNTPGFGDAYFEEKIKQILHESSGNWKNISKTNAQGLFQILPGTAKLIKSSITNHYLFKNDKNFPFREQILQADISQKNLRENSAFGFMLSIAHDYMVLTEMEHIKLGITSKYNPIKLVHMGYLYGTENALKRLNMTEKHRYVKAIQNIPSDFFTKSLYKSKQKSAQPSPKNTLP